MKKYFLKSSYAGDSYKTFVALVREKGLCYCPSPSSSLKDSCGAWTHSSHLQPGGEQQEEGRVGRCKTAGSLMMLLSS